MRLIVSEKARHEVLEFYAQALTRHPSLDEAVVVKKIERLFESLNFLSVFPEAYGYARVRTDWVEAGYREFLCEDFHFAYEICTDADGETCVLVADAVHSLLNH